MATDVLVTVLAVTLSAALGALGWAIARLFATLDRIDSRLDLHDRRIERLEWAAEHETRRARQT